MRTLLILTALVALVAIAAESRSTPAATGPAPAPAPGSGAPGAAGPRATIDPTQMLAALKRSYTQEGVKEYSAAIAAIEPMSGDYLIDLRLGWLHYLNGAHVKAITNYEKAIAAAPASIEAKLGCTLPLMALERHAEVEALSRQVLQADPGNYYANLRLVYALRMRKKLDEAEVVMARSLKAYPADSGALAERGYLALARQQPAPTTPATASAQAKECYGKSYEAEAAGRYTEAIAALEPIARGDSNDYTLNLRQGWLHYLHGAHVSALRHYAEAVKATPTSIEARLGFTLPLMALGRWEELETEMAKLTASEPASYYGNLRLAYALRMLGRLEQAEKVGKAMLARYPADALFTTELALTQAARGQTSEATTTFTRLQMLDPDNATAKTYLGKQR